MSFSSWKADKAKTALIDEAQALADRLAYAKPHFVELAAAAWFWQAFHLADGQDLNSLSDWPPAARKRFVSGAVTRIAALLKAREYDSSDGLGDLDAHRPCPSNRRCCPPSARSGSMSGMPR